MLDALLVLHHPRGPSSFQQGKSYRDQLPHEQLTSPSDLNCPAAKSSVLTLNQYAFLLQVISQLGGERPSIKFDKINLPGRSPKALSHLWAKIKGEIEAGGFDKQTGVANGAAGPAIPKTPRKKKAETNGKWWNT